MTDNLTKQIKQHAMVFALDNFTVPNEQDILIIENAMMIGAGLAMTSFTENLMQETFKTVVSNLDESGSMP